MYLNSNISSISLPSEVLSIAGKNGILSFQSQLNLNQVFTGDFIDDFCLSSFYSPHAEAELVLLGSSIGSAIRPSLCAKPYRRVTFVDTDERVLKQAKTIYKGFEYSESFHYVNRDAVSYLRNRKTPIKGTVLVDLFDETGHSADSFLHNNLFSLLREKMDKRSVGHLNVYAYPIFLGIDSRPLRFFSQKIDDSFDSTQIFPHRRNISILFSPEPLQKQEFAPPLNTRDIDSLALKAKYHLKAITYSAAEMADDGLSYNEINVDFNKNYLLFTKELAGITGVDILSQDQIGIFSEQAIFDQICRALKAAPNSKCFCFLVCVMAAQVSDYQNALIPRIKPLFELYLQLKTEMQEAQLINQWLCLLLKLATFEPHWRSRFDYLVNEIEKGLLHD